MKPFDANGAFHPVGAGRELTRRAVKGAGVNLFSGGVGLVIQTTATVVLARLLAPHDFGLVAMVTTFSLLLVNFGVNGITEAVIQREDLDEALASNLFWVAVAGGFLLTVAFAASGSLLAWFYRSPLIQGITVWISLSIFITSTSVQHLALLMRAMRFSAVSANEIVARAISVTVSICLGLAGWGYWALVAGVVMLPLSVSVGAWLLCRWTPRLPRRHAGTALALWFAFNTYGRFAINYFARNVDNLLVGQHFGVVPLGFYKRAYDLFALPASQVSMPLTQVALSTLSRLNPRSELFRQHYVKALAILAFVGMGLSGVLTLVGEDLIRFVLGARWEPAGRIFRFFGPGIGIMLIYNSHGWIHLSIGKADRWFRWVIVEVVVTVLCFLFALPWGPSGIAVAWGLSFWILTVPGLWYAGRPIGFRVGQMLAGIWRYILAALLAGYACAAIGWVMPSDTVVGTIETGERIVSVSLLFGVLYLGMVTLLHGGWEPLRQFVDLIRGMAPSGILPTGPDTLSTAPAAPVHAEAGIVTDGREPLVSILIPAYNSEKWLAACIESALAQSWKRKEVIVVDDGSTDRTLAIARRFEARGVRVVTQRNRGAAAARNAAWALSKGDYIQWLDADDLLHPDKITRQVNTIAKDSCKRILVSSAFGRFSYRYYRPDIIPTALWCDLCPEEWLLRKMENNIYMQTATWLVSRELTEAAGLWDTRLLGDDDGEYFCRVLLASERVRFVPDAMMYYRAPLPASLSRVGSSGKKLRAHWLSMQLHIQYLLGLENNERTRAACVTFMQASFSYFYPEWVDIVGEMETKARELGGELSPPRLSWKYSWLLHSCGWGPAKHLQIVAPRARWMLRRQWDKLLYWIQAGGVAGPKLAERAMKESPIQAVASTSDTSHLEC